jgi:hypothetical protein
VNKALRDAERAAVMAAYESRIASGNKDVRLGFAALQCYMGLIIASNIVLFFLPALIVQIVRSYLEPSQALEVVGNVLIFFGFFWFVVRILLPVSFDVVWRMDILSNKIGFIRPNDILRLFSVWVSPRELGELLRRRWSPDA